MAYGWQADTMYGTAPLWQAQVSNNNLQTAQYHYLITDHLGTPQMAVNQNGETTWKATSEVFGKTTPDATSQITMNLRFPGQYYDAETNTHYNYFRDYNPALGRYVQRDPIGLRGGINTYGYVVGNSLRYYDPQGKLAQFLIVGGAIGLVIIGGWWYGQQSQQQTGDNGDGFNFGGQGSTGSSEGSSGGSKDTLPPPPIPVIRTIEWPGKTKGNWTCNARADCNDNIPGNCPDNPILRQAFGSGTEKSLGEARNVAKSSATQNLMCQPKHVSCKCTGPKGEFYSGGC